MPTYVTRRKDPHDIGKQLPCHPICWANNHHVLPKSYLFSLDYCEYLIFSLCCVLLLT